MKAFSLAKGQKPSQVPGHGDVLCLKKKNLENRGLTPGPSVCQSQLSWGAAKTNIRKTKWSLHKIPINCLLTLEIDKETEWHFCKPGTKNWDGSDRQGKKT